MPGDNDLGKKKAEAMMRALIKRWSIGWILLLLMSVASVFGAWAFGPHRPHHPRDPKPPVGVAEPAAIALLGVGLVSLGIYAKKKRGKKD